jgi:hypothetical protein
VPARDPQCLQTTVVEAGFDPDARRTSDSSATESECFQELDVHVH